MINVVVPMAGAGSRFAKEGYKLPKPFIDVKGKMMIERVLEGLKIKNAHYTLIIRKEFLTEYIDQLNTISSNYPVAFICVDKLTAGACCTAMAAHKVINNSYPVLIADSDNIFKPGIIQSFVDDCLNRTLDGSLLTFKSDQPCFSFASLDDSGVVKKTAEKQQISEHAIAGAYMFSRGYDFVDCALDMFIYEDKSQNEFYMSNVYNHACSLKLKCGIYDISGEDWDCVGTPKQLEKFIN